MGVSVPLIAVLGVVIAQRLVELVIAKRNTDALLREGGVEHGAGHYLLIVAMHVAWLVAWPLEVWFSKGGLVSWWLWPALGVVVAQVLRYAAIRGLGKRWTTRIIVLPGAPRIDRGLYGVIPHPNYLAVALELALLPVLFGAWWSAGVFTVLNAIVLLGVRIPAEERALAAR